MTPGLCRISSVTLSIPLERRSASVAARKSPSRRDGSSSGAGRISRRVSLVPGKLSQSWVWKDSSMSSPSRLWWVAAVPTASAVQRTSSVTLGDLVLIDPVKLQRLGQFKDRRNRPAKVVDVEQLCRTPSQFPPETTYFFDHPHINFAIVAPPKPREAMPQDRKQHIRRYSLVCYGFHRRQ